MSLVENTYMLKYAMFKTLLALREHGSLVAASNDLVFNAFCTFTPVERARSLVWGQVVNQRTRPVTFFECWATFTTPC